MMDLKRVHILDDEGVIVNTIVVENLDDYVGAVDASMGGTIGDKIVNGVLVVKQTVSPPPIVPQVVTRRQARQALLIRDLLSLVEPAIESIEDPLQRGLALIEWQDATEFERNRELVIQIGTALGLDEEGLNELFTFAATL